MNKDALIRGVTFRYYDLPVGVPTPEVRVEEGVITHNLTDEEIDDPEIARIFGMLLQMAAEELALEGK
jgi:hypothetical protein